MNSRACIRIGFAAPLTGDQAVVGVPMAQVAAMAVAEVNDGGQLPFHLELVAIDDRATEEGALAAANGFVNDLSVLAVVGHKNTGPCLRAGELYEGSHLAHLTPSATGVSLSQARRSSFFRLCCHDQAQGELAGAFVRQELGAKRPLVVNDGTSYGRSLAGAFGEAIALDQSVTQLELEIEEGHARYPQVIDAIECADADLLYLALTEIEGALVAKEVRQAGYRLPLVGADGSRQTKFPELAGQAADGAFMTYAGFDAHSTETGQAFIRRYQAIYHDAPPVYAPEVHDAVGAIARAVLACVTHQSPRRDQLLRALKEMPAWEGLTGLVCFDEQGERVGIKPSMWVVRGDRVLLWPED